MKQITIALLAIGALIGCSNDSYESTMVSQNSASQQSNKAPLCLSPKSEVPELMFRDDGRAKLCKIEYEQRATEAGLIVRSAKLIYNMVKGMLEDGSLALSGIETIIENYDSDNFDAQGAQDMMFSLMKALPEIKTADDPDMEPYTLDIVTMLKEVLKFALCAPVTNGIHEYVYTYQTINGKGELTTASATLYLPQKSLFTRKVPTLVMPHYGDLKRSTAPSCNIVKGFGYGIEKVEDLEFVSTLLMELLARSGYAMIYPDGIGVGSNHEAIPMVTKISAYNVIDAILAAQEIETDFHDAVWDKDDLNIISLSLGAYTALETAKVIQTEYSDLLKVKTTALVDGPFDISGIMMGEFINNDNTKFYVPSLVFSFDNVFGAYEPGFLYTNALRNDIPGFQEGYKNAYNDPKANEPVRAANNYLEETLGVDYIDQTQALSQEFIEGIQNPTSNLQKCLKTCDAFYNWVPEMPVMFFHNPGDPTVIVENSYKAVEEFRKAGCTNVGVTLFPEYLEQIYFHGGACVVGMFKAFKWIDRQIYGKRFVNQ